MTGINRQRYYRPAWYFHIINLCTYFVYRLLKVFCNKNNSNKYPSPLLITGMFRSGTTIVADIYNKLGFSPGPSDHLLTAKGTRQLLNPNGFLENYFFMDLSLYAFLKTNSWGDCPPGKDICNTLEFSVKDRTEMAYFSIVTIHDDRISNFNKVKVLLNSAVNNPGIYLQKYFSNNSFIKNPHFAVLFPYVKKIFSSSRVIVVFRNPVDTVTSAKKITPLADFDLYNCYYREVCDEFRRGNRNIEFVSYEKLVTETQISLKKLMDHENCTNEITADLIISKIHSLSVVTGINNCPAETQDLYKFMLANCIN